VTYFPERRIESDQFAHAAPAQMIPAMLSARANSS
jgi:hypothetical protein